MSRRDPRREERRQDPDARAQERERDRELREELADADPDIDHPEDIPIQDIDPEETPERIEQTRLDVAEGEMREELADEYRPIERPEEAPVVRDDEDLVVEVDEDRLDEIQREEVRLETADEFGFVDDPSEVDVVEEDDELRPDPDYIEQQAIEATQEETAAQFDRFEPRDIPVETGEDGVRVDPDWIEEREEERREEIRVDIADEFETVDDPSEVEVVEGDDELRPDPDWLEEAEGREEDYLRDEAREEVREQAADELEFVDDPAEVEVVEGDGEFQVDDDWLDEEVDAFREERREEFRADVADELEDAGFDVAPSDIPLVEDDDGIVVDDDFTDTLREERETELRQQAADELEIIDDPEEVPITETDDGVQVDTDEIEERLEERREEIIEETQDDVLEELGTEVAYEHTEHGWEARFDPDEEQPPDGTDWERIGEFVGETDVSVDEFENIESTDELDDTLDNIEDDLSEPPDAVLFDPTDRHSVAAVDRDLPDLGLPDVGVPDPAAITDPITGTVENIRELDIPGGELDFGAPRDRLESIGAGLAATPEIAREGLETVAAIEDRLSPEMEMPDEEDAEPVDIDVSMPSREAVGAGVATTGRAVQRLPTLPTTAIGTAAIGAGVVIEEGEIPFRREEDRSELEIEDPQVESELGVGAGIGAVSELGIEDPMVETEIEPTQETPDEVGLPEFGGVIETPTPVDDGVGIGEGPTIPREELPGREEREYQPTRDIGVGSGIIDGAVREQEPVETTDPLDQFPDRDETTGGWMDPSLPGRETDPFGGFTDSWIGDDDEVEDTVPSPTVGLRDGDFAVPEVDPFGEAEGIVDPFGFGDLREGVETEEELGIGIGARADVDADVDTAAAPDVAEQPLTTPEDAFAEFEGMGTREAQPIQTMPQQQQRGRGRQGPPTPTIDLYADEIGGVDEEIVTESEIWDTEFDPVEEIGDLFGD